MYLCFIYKPFRCTARSFAVIYDLAVPINIPRKATGKRFDKLVASLLVS